METKFQKKVKWGLPTAFFLPLCLIVLFELLKGKQEIMEVWVFGVLAPVAQCLGRLWSVFPLSGMELLIAFTVVWVVVWTVRAIVLVVRSRDWKNFIRRLLALTAAGLWIWCGICWMWNVTYYAPAFSQKSGLTIETYSVEELKQVTAYFAQQAGELAGQVERDDEGHFVRNTWEYLEQGTSIYSAIEEEFPFLHMESVKAKPILCSRLQSMMGFTGMYFPFTGEANVNVDAPAALFPVTIAHEMAHQRMVAAELEANFVGIAACLSCDNVTFQYSGALLGLIQLCNALYPVDRDAWYEITAQYFTPELAVDWNDNNDYWHSLESRVEEVAEQAYDSFLKGNDQELGMRSYGACVDLLVAYYGADADRMAG